MSTPDPRHVEVPESVLITETAGEAVLLDLESEHYFGLNEVGTRMWQALTETGSVDAAHAVLAAEFDVDADTLRRDLDALVEELLAAGLLEETDGQATPHP